MISIDPRIGSADLLPLLQSHGLPAEIRHLPYGDVCWMGNGPSGPATAPCVVERKRLGDILNCMDDGRFVSQLRGMLSMYEYLYLVVEDDYYSDQAGNLMQYGKPVPRWGKRRVQESWRYSAVRHWLTTMRVKHGVMVLETGSAKETAREIALEYSWWTTKEWGDHKADQGFDGSAGRRVTGAGSAGQVQLVRPNLVQEWAGKLPGVGWEWSLAARAAFKTPLELAQADEVKWAVLKGGKGESRFGKKRAEAVVRAIRG